MEGDRPFIIKTKNRDETARYFAAIKDITYRGNIFRVTDPWIDEAQKNWYGLPVVTTDAQIPLLPVELANPLPKSRKIFAPTAKAYDGLYMIQAVLAEEIFWKGNEDK